LPFPFVMRASAFRHGSGSQWELRLIPVNGRPASQA
jgi:hypothetical protein